MKIEGIIAHKNLIILALLFLPSFAVVPHEAFADNYIEIAFLQDTCESPGSDNKYITIVRLAFASHDSIWQAFDHNVENSEELHAAATKFAGKHDWFLVDHDKILSKVTSNGVKTYKWYKDIGKQNLISELPVAAKSTRSLKYSGWIGCPVRKPIVLSSAQPTPDKEHWTKEKVDIVPSAKMAEQMNNLNLDLYGTDDDKHQKVNFSAKDLMVKEQYGSLAKGKLIALQFRPQSGVMNNTSEPDSSLYWFFIGQNSAIKFVGSGLVLIDWADYNSDGRTDFLFWVDGYNINGYFVASDDFGQTASFTWNYH